MLICSAVCMSVHYREFGWADCMEACRFCQCWLAWAKYTIGNLSIQKWLFFHLPSVLCLFALQNSTLLVSASPVWSIWWDLLTAHYTTMFMEVNRLLLFLFPDWRSIRSLGRQFLALSLSVLMPESCRVHSRVRVTRSWKKWEISKGPLSKSFNISKEWIYCLQCEGSLIVSSQLRIYRGWRPRFISQVLVDKTRAEEHRVRNLY